MVSEKEILASQQLVIDTFKEFRPELMAAYGKIPYLVKEDASPVTEFDVTIETRLKQKLLEAFPEFGFKGEETEHVEGANGGTWYVDPIDGTTSFIRGLPYCSNMAGLVVDGVIVASVIYHFAADELFSAVRGRGAFKNGERLTMRNPPLAVSAVFSNAVAYEVAAPLFRDEGIRFFCPIGATGYFLTRLAQGSIEGVCYLRSRNKHHDMIPGSLIVEEAGGSAVTFDGEPFGVDSLEVMLGTSNVCHATQAYKRDILKNLDKR